MSPGVREVRLAILSTGRQDWGGLSVVAHRLKQQPKIHVAIVAGGMHAREGVIPSSLDGLAVEATVPVLPISDSDESVARAAGQTTLAVVDALKGIRANALMVLGDRTETLGAAVAATCLKLPILHFHGGEESVGAIDNACRHAITKLSHVHFVAHASFRRRLERMGERPDRIFVTGAPALDAARLADPLSRDALAERLKLDASKEWIVCTHHPATLGAETEIEHLVTALSNTLSLGRSAIQIIITRPNVDAGSSNVLTQLETFTAHHPSSVRLVTALGHQVYFSLLRQCVAMVGNSSSGIIEAPLFQLPTVNIGVRQDGRLRGANVIDVPAEHTAIEEALRHARSPEAHARLANTTSPYGDGSAANGVAEALAELGDSLIDDIAKPFAETGETSK